MIHASLAIAGALLNVLAGVSYIKATLEGEAKPNRVTWLLWSVAPLIATAAQLASGIGISTLIVFASGFMPFCVFLASFANRSAYWRLGGFDYACGLASILALVFWATTRNPITAIIFSILSDGLGALPTLKKAYLHPHTEDRRTYLIGMFGAFLGAFSIIDHSFAGYAFNAYLCALYVGMTGLLYRSPILSTFRRSSNE